MSDLYIRRDRRGKIVLYRVSTNQGIILTDAECTVIGRAFIYESFLTSHPPLEPFAYDVRDTFYGKNSPEFHRRILYTSRGLKIPLELSAPDLFDVRRDEDCE